MWVSRSLFCNLCFFKSKYFLYCLFCLFCQSMSYLIILLFLFLLYRQSYFTYCPFPKISSKHGSIIFQRHWNIMLGISLFSKDTTISFCFTSLNPALSNRTFVRLGQELLFYVSLPIYGLTASWRECYFCSCFNLLCFLWIHIWLTFPCPMCLPCWCASTALHLHKMINGWLRRL